MNKEHIVEVTNYEKRLIKLEGREKELEEEN